MSIQVKEIYLVMITSKSNTSYSKVYCKRNSYEEAQSVVNSIQKNGFNIHIKKGYEPK